jgi:hypothetical protein
MGKAWSYTLPGVKDPLGLTISLSLVITPSAARSWLLYNASTNTLSVAAGAAGEAVAKYTAEVKVSAPGRN